MLCQPFEKNDEYPTEFASNFVDFVSCPHKTYFDTVLHWGKGVLPLLFRPEKQTTSTQLFSLQFSTIIRDPLDRLVSYFH
jgi:hypothetical protein